MGCIHTGTHSDFGSTIFVRPLQWLVNLNLSLKLAQIFLTCLNAVCYLEGRLGKILAPQMNHNTTSIGTTHMQKDTHTQMHTQLSIQMHTHAAFPGTQMNLWKHAPSSTLHTSVSLISVLQHVCWMINNGTVGFKLIICGGERAVKRVGKAVDVSCCVRGAGGRGWGEG